MEDNSLINITTPKKKNNAYLSPRALWKPGQSSSTPRESLTNLTSPSIIKSSLINNFDFFNDTLLNDIYLTPTSNHFIDSNISLSSNFSGNKLGFNDIDEEEISEYMKRLKLFETDNNDKRNKFGDNDSNDSIQAAKDFINNLKGIKKVQKKTSPIYKTKTTKKLYAASSLKENKKLTNLDKKKMNNNKKSSPPKYSSNCIESRLTKIARSPILHTAKRAELRKIREETLKEKEIELEKIRQQEEEKQKELEKKEILHLRKLTEFKAHPIRKYAAVPEIKKRELTEPITPKFCKRRRVLSSIENNNYIK